MNNILMPNYILKLNNVSLLYFEASPKKCLI